jgi:hypothetical protein
LQSGATATLYLGGLDVNGDLRTNDRPSLANPGVALNMTPACFANPTCVTGLGLNDPADAALLGASFVDLGQLFFGANGGGNILPVTANQEHFVANAGQNGNVTRNSIDLPGLEQYNLSVIKNFKMPFGESHMLQFRGDFFNAFNHFNAGQNVESTYGNLLNPGFGVLGPKSLTLDGGRSIVIWIKYLF